MATDATGTPTSLGFPTLNLSVDAPSGLALNEMMAAIDALLVSRLPPTTYTAYTPTWYGAGGNPAILNGTIAGRWVQVGKTVHAYAKITAGSSTTFGSGAWGISLPSTPNAAYAQFDNLGGWSLISVGTNGYSGFAQYSAGAFASPGVYLNIAASTNYAAQSSPISMASTNILSMHVIYETT